MSVKEVGKMFRYNDVSFGQFRGCLFVQIGSTAFGLSCLLGDRSWGLELLTPSRWFAFRPFRYLTVRR
jgi:hypothetical protein